MHPLGTFIHAGALMRLPILLNALVLNRGKTELLATPSGSAINYQVHVAQRHSFLIHLHPTYQYIPWNVLASSTLILDVQRRVIVGQL